MTSRLEIGRRGFLSLTGAGVMAPAVASSNADGAAASMFAHGVASGDPTQNSVLIWTRATPVGLHNASDVAVGWEVSMDIGFSDVIQSGDVVAQAAADHTVTVDIEGLAPGTTYFYRFTAANDISRVGRTQTLPSKSDRNFRVAVVSCANYASGFFNAYRDIASQDDIDLVIHLGDYIYEEGLGGFGTNHAREMNRVPEPNKELVTLEDYRSRYAQYRMDPDLQDLHASVPIICIWDDHEIVNGTWAGGSLDHLEEEAGSWPERRQAAMRAYHEWLPLRLEAPADQSRIFRSFDGGALFRLTMLDTRHFARNESLPRPDGLVSYISAEVKRRFDGRSVLGDEQEAWLENEIDSASSARWHLLGQQFLVTPLHVPDLETLVDMDAPNLLSREALEGFVSFSKLNPLFLNDSWEGYQTARQKFVKALAESQSAPVVLTGDIHMTVAADILNDDHVVAHELVAPSVTSPGMDQVFPSKSEGSVDRGFEEENEGIRHLKSGNHGWLRLEISMSDHQAEWRYGSNILGKEFEYIHGKRATTSRTSNGPTEMSIVDSG